MIQAIRPTSKASLKLQCLWVSQGDVKKAKELYDFFVSDMPDLPDHDPQPVSWVDHTKNTVNGLMEWLKTNQDTLAQGYEFIRTVIVNRGALPSAAPVADPLPDINPPS